MRSDYTSAVLGYGDTFSKGLATTYNKAYALRSEYLAWASPNRGGEAAATSHKQNVICNDSKTLAGRPCPAT